MLSACKKGDPRTHYTGNYSCSYESSSGVDGSPESYSDTSYEISITLLSREDEKFKLTGDKYIVLFFNEENASISEEFGAYEKWNGEFTSVNAFNLSKGTDYWGHFSSERMNCTR